VFCIVGENGSGKSTALQIVAGILQPTSGSIEVNGRVAALLELGAGFNPEFTGRDNVYLNASILGLSRREIDRRYREIEEFAEIGDFIRQPVKTYSSGMIVRLAFAVAITVDPEILLVDEALAVGDAYFRHRCMRKVHELRARGVTILFVSHAVADVKAIGDRILWLEHGRAVAIGAADAVLPQYLSAMTAREQARENAGDPPPLQDVADSIPNVDHRHGDGRAEIVGIAVLNEYGEPVRLMLSQSRVMVRITFRANDELRNPAAGFLLRNHLGLDFSGVDTEREGHHVPPMRKDGMVTVDFQLDIPEFYPGAFSFSPFVSDGGRIADWIDNGLTVQMARGDGPVYGYIHTPCRTEFSGNVRAASVRTGGKSGQARLESSLA
jgi:ABC-type polysaccharide/polyol phosphate transport system ATPase subunit